MTLSRRTVLAGAVAISIPKIAVAQDMIIDILYPIPQFARFHEPVAAMFMQKNPGVKIQFRAPAPGYDDGHQTILRAAMTRQLPDVYYSGYHLLPELVRTLKQRGQIVALDDFMAKEGDAFRTDNYADAILNLGKVEGKLYGIAFNASNPIVFFNADLVRKAGADPDKFPTTFDGVIALAAKINDPANGINGMSYAAHAWPDAWLFEALISQSGGRLITEDGTDIAFDGPHGLSAMKLFRRFVTEGGMNVIDRDQTMQQLAAGKLGIYFASPNATAQLTKNVGDKFTLRTTKFPIDDPKNGRIPTGGNAVVMFAQDPARQKVIWEFIKLATSPEAQKIVVEMSGYLPTNLRASGPEYLGPFYDANPNYRAPITQVERAGPWSAYPGGNAVRIWRTQRDLIAKVMRGELTPESGLAEITKATRDLIKGA